MLTPGFLEGMNAILFVLYLICVFMFANYIRFTVSKHGFVRARVQAAIAFLAVCFGEMIARGWIWQWRHQINGGLDASWMTNYPVLAVGTAIQIVGVLCMIRVFSPDDWGRYGWLVSGVIALILGISFVFI